MPRPLRISGPGVVHHIISRCNNEEFLFLTDWDFRMYLEMIQKYKREFKFKLFHYALMHNHTHLQIEVGKKGNVSEIMQRINGEYAKLYNDEHRRKGHFWQGRFRSTLIEDENYFLRCGMYIELNAVRAGLVNKPQQWKHSSVRAYIETEKDKLIDISSVYLSLGRDREKRIEEYSQMLFSELKRTKEIQCSLEKEDQKQIRQLLRINYKEPIPFRNRITKLFNYGIGGIINP